MDIAVSSRMARRRGATKEHVLYGPVTEEQRSRRVIIGETLRAKAFLPFGCVIPASGSRPARISLWTKGQNSLGSSVHSFLSGCLMRAEACSPPALLEPSIIEN